MKRALTFLALAGLSGAAMAQQQQDPLSQIQIGVSPGWYLPTSKDLQDAFGAQIFTLGLGPVSTSRPVSNKLSPTFNIIGADRDGNRFLQVPVTLGYEWHFGDDKSSTFPFARLDAGLSYYNFDIGSASGSGVGYVGSATVGYVLSQNLQVSAKYYLFQDRDGINFNGLQLAVTIALFHL
ncbi:MAG TPA: outer membrane beta-barrel protein [Fimbriimonas sp.]|nr:outer membrane beta-barrel protein [Fimbriimonas sp.]